VGGWGEILQLLSGEDIDTSQVDLGVSVLSGLRGGHVDDLARSSLDDNMTKAIVSNSSFVGWREKPTRSCGEQNIALGM
jgi:hypothetical protein